MTAPAGGRGILLDVEGTTSSISYVYDVLFPFAREHVREFTRQRQDDDDVRAAWALIEEEAGRPLADVDALVTEVHRLMDADAKTTGLKQLQGLVWRQGYESGELTSHVFPDVRPALERWRERGVPVRIYSSGSVEAQRLFFGHTEQGDLLAYLDGHHDTRTGPKGEPSSYRAIAGDWGLEPADVLFVSDVLAELDAARTAGMKTALCVRPGNREVTERHDHEVIRSFADLP